MAPRLDRARREDEKNNPTHRVDSSGDEEYNLPRLARPLQHVYNEKLRLNTLVYHKLFIFYQWTVNYQSSLSSSSLVY